MGRGLSARRRLVLRLERLFPLERSLLRRCAPEIGLGSRRLKSQRRLGVSGRKVGQLG
jgi:hypothetical protein